MPGQKRPSNASVVALLNRYHCPTPLPAVRALFMGSIASPLLSRSPVQTIQGLWAGDLPPFDTVDDLHHFLRVLMDGIWNPLTAHQIVSSPFKITRLQLKPTRKSVHRYALVRQQEIEGFMDGLFGPQEELDLPESARNAVEVLGELRAMFAGAVTLLDDPGKPAAPEDLKGLSDSLQALAAILEKEMNTVILSCTRARRQMLAETKQTRSTAL